VVNIASAGEVKLESVKTKHPKFTNPLAGGVGGILKISHMY